MAAHKPPQDGFFLHAGDWLRRRAPHSRQTVLFLPKRARCFHGRLLLSLPADFRVNAQRRDTVVFTGSRSGLRMTVMRMPFRRPLHSISAMDLQLAFRRLSLPEKFPEMKRGFLRYSPTLTAIWSAGTYKTEKTVLHLIQVQKTVFLLLFRNVAPENEDYVSAVIYAASVMKDQ